MDLILNVLTGGATGLLGSIFGKLFSFIDMWQEEKKSENEHKRTVALLKLQNQIGADENEREMAVAQANADTAIRLASYTHDTMAGTGSQWVIDMLRLVRPVLTFTLVVLVGVIYLDEPVSRQGIEASVLYMCSAAVLWWFGERMLNKKRK
jgi:hypothetical protein